MSSILVSKQLRKKIAMAFPLLADAGAVIEQSPELKSVYPSYLCALHSMIRATVPLMNAALKECEAHAGEDPVCAAMIPYLRKHIKEERGHDEWLLQDLETIGIGREEVLAIRPSQAVATLVGSQYYWVHHYHPVALLGYIAVMEGAPPNRAMLYEWVVRTGYPKSAFRTLLMHATIDVQHREDLDRFLDTLPLGEGEITLLGLSAFSAIEHAATAIRESVTRRPGLVGVHTCNENPKTIGRLKEERR